MYGYPEQFIPQPEYPARPGMHAAPQLRRPVTAMTPPDRPSEA